MYGTMDMTVRFVCPGFIDGHIHLESSMVAPHEFETEVLPHGTTTVITDPHEISNVAGLQGLDYMLDEINKWLCPRKRFYRFCKDRAIVISFYSAVSVEPF